uniref:Protein krueppel n=1 Tax=Anopheles culicifacies TaxID=139723 RepID=A0A182MRF3_9DIPT
MEEITLESVEIKFDLVCRFCLSDTDCLPVFLPDGNINNRLQKAFEIIASKVDENDGLPNNICGGCLQCIEDFVDFETNCSKSYEILMKYIHDATSSLDCGLERPIKAEHEEEILIDDIEAAEYTCNSVQEIPASDDDHTALEEDLVLDELELLEQTYSNEEHSIISKTDTVEQQENITDKSKNEELQTAASDPAAHALTNDAYIAACNAPVLHYFQRKDRKVAIVQCTYCDKTFRGRGTLRKHLRIHFQIRNYSCQVCDRTFTDRSSLRTHEVRHSGTKPFKCELCGRCCYTKPELRQHWVAVHAIRNHTCPICGKKFASKTTLQDHASVHAVERPFVCSTCGKSFKRNRNLIRHYQNHAKSKSMVRDEPEFGSNNTTCQYCDEVFEKPSTLLEHLKQQHRDEYEQSGMKIHLEVHQMGGSDALQIDYERHSADHHLIVFAHHDIVNHCAHLHNVGKRAATHLKPPYTYKKYFGIPTQERDQELIVDKARWQVQLGEPRTDHFQMAFHLGGVFVELSFRNLGQLG